MKFVRGERKDMMFKRDGIVVNKSQAQGDTNDRDIKFVSDELVREKSKQIEEQYEDAFKKLSQGPTK